MVSTKVYERHEEYDKKPDEEQVNVPHELFPFQKHSIPNDYKWERDFPQGIYTDDDIKEMLEKLTPRQVTYADLQIRGLSASAAAERCAAGPYTCRAWEKTPWWEPLMEKRRRIYYGDKASIFLPLMPKAIERLEKELTGESGNQIAHDAMAMVFGFLYEKPAQQKVVQREGNDTLADLATVLRAAFGENERLKAEQQPLLDKPIIAEVREVT